MTERTKNADFHRKPQIFADSPLLLEIPAFGGRKKPQKAVDFRRKPKIVAENRRKPQIGLRHLGPSPLARPYRKWGTSTFSGDPQRGVWVGAKSLCLKEFMCFSVLTEASCLKTIWNSSSSLAHSEYESEKDMGDNLPVANLGDGLEVEFYGCGHSHACAVMRDTSTGATVASESLKGCEPSRP